MHEVLPGVFHWTAIHPGIHSEVSSYWLQDDGVLIDPIVPPDGGLDWFDRRPRPPQSIILSCRHHYRDSARFQERFDCPVSVPRAGLHEFTDGEPVSGYDPGDELPGGLLAVEVGSLSADETALYLRPRHAVWFADGVVRAPGDRGGPIGFVPDGLMDAPPQTKRGLLTAFTRMLRELQFEHLLLAHGGPVLGDGRAQLRDLVRSGGRTAFAL